jgi:hypothetical protein
MSIINKPPQHVKREYELEEPVALVVEKYATFIDSTPDHVVNSALKMLLWKDKEFDGDPTATDSTRVLCLPGFANKKYEVDFNVQARAESTQTYNLRDFKLQIVSQDAPRHQHEEVARKQSAPSSTLSQSEHDWAYAKRALARGDDPDEVIRRISDYRANDKHDSVYYARHTVNKARAELQQKNAPVNTTDQGPAKSDERAQSVSNPIP